MAALPTSKFLPVAQQPTASLSSLLRHLAAISATGRCSVTAAPLALPFLAHRLACQSGPGGGSVNPRIPGARSLNTGMRRRRCGSLPPVARQHVRSELTFLLQHALEVARPGSFKLSEYFNSLPQSPPLLIGCCFWDSLRG